MGRPCRSAVRGLCLLPTSPATQPERSLSSRWRRKGQEITPGLLRVRAARQEALQVVLQDDKVGIGATGARVVPVEERLPRVAHPVLHLADVAPHARVVPAAPCRRQSARPLAASSPSQANASSKHKHARPNMSISMSMPMYMYMSRYIYIYVRILIFKRLQPLQNIHRSI